MSGFVGYSILGIMVIISITIISYVLLRETCNDPLKCYWGSNCVAIPKYYTKNYDKKCILDCSDYDMCIQGSKCIKITNGLEKNLTTNRCQKISNYIF